MNQRKVDDLRELLVGFARFLDAIGDDGYQAYMLRLVRELDESRSRRTVRNVQRQLREVLRGGMGSLNDAPPTRRDSSHYSFSGTEGEMYEKHYGYVDALGKAAYRVFW